jgi:hypothetical protein
MTPTILVLAARAIMRRVPMARDVIVIGSDPSCDIVIGSSRMPPRALRVQLWNGELLVEALADGASFMGPARPLHVGLLEPFVADVMLPDGSIVGCTGRR